MSVKVRWYDEQKRIIYLAFVGRWTWDEFRPAYDDLIVMMDSVNYKVDFICDMQTSEHIPAGVLREVKRAADRNHPNMGLAVYVGMNPLLQALSAIFRNIYPASASRYPVAFVPTIPEAEALLARTQAERE